MALTPVLLAALLALACSVYCAVPLAAAPDTGQPPGRQEKDAVAPPDLRHNISRSRFYARAEAVFLVNAPRELVWQTLTDYDNYPKIFHRIQSCSVVRRNGHLVYLESNLKPHLFVRKQHNRTVNDLSDGPEALDWWLDEGNFNDARGRWELAPDARGCRVTYRLEVDAGPVVPAFLVSFILKLVQKEVASELTEYVEQRLTRQPYKRDLAGRPFNMSVR